MGIIIELRAAEGGQHAEYLAKDLASAYTKYLERVG